MRKHSEPGESHGSPVSGPNHATPGKATLSGALQRKATGAAAAGSEQRVREAAADGGTPLPTETRERGERSFGVDLGAVRVHTSAASQAATESVGARAYAQGSDIHFGAGEYAPGSAAGERLLLHEVAHTVQQGGAGGAPQFQLAVGRTDDPLEHEADVAADAALAGRPAALSRAGSALQRTPGETSRMATQDEVATAIRALDRITEIDAVIRALEAMPAEADGMTEVTIGSRGFGVQYAWAEALARVATVRRAELAATVAPAVSVGDSAASDPLAYEDSEGLGVGVELGARAVIDTPIGQFEIGGSLRARTAGAVRSTGTGRGTYRRTERDPGASASVEAGISGTGGTLYDSGEDAPPLFRGDHVRFDRTRVRARATASTGASTTGAASASAGMGIVVTLDFHYDTTPVSIDLYPELVGFEASAGGTSPSRLRLRLPNVSGSVAVDDVGTFSVRYTPFSAVTLFEAAGGAATYLGAGSATVGAAAVADGGAAAAGIVTEGVVVTTAGTLVGGLVLVGLIGAALEGVWDGQRAIMAELDGAMRVARTVAGELGTRLGDFCAGYVAVMRGLPEPDSSGGQLGAREARARIAALSETQSLDTIRANAIATGDLYQQVYALAAPVFRDAGQRIIHEMSSAHSRYTADDIRAMARPLFEEAIAGAASPGGVPVGPPAP